MGEDLDLLTCAEVATLLRLGSGDGDAGAQAVRRMIRTGELPASLVGKRYLVARADVAQLLAARRAPVILAGGREAPRAG